MLFSLLLLAVHLWAPGTTQASRSCSFFLNAVACIGSMLGVGCSSTPRKYWIWAPVEPIETDAPIQPLPIEALDPQSAERLGDEQFEEGEFANSVRFYRRSNQPVQNKTSQALRNISRPRLLDKKEHERVSNALKLVVSIKNAMTKDPFFTTDISTLQVPQIIVWQNKLYALFAPVFGSYIEKAELVFVELDLRTSRISHLQRFMAIPLRGNFLEAPQAQIGFHPDESKAIQIVINGKRFVFDTISRTLITKGHVEEGDEVFQEMASYEKSEFIHVSVTEQELLPALENTALNVFPLRAYFEPFSVDEKIFRAVAILKSLSIEGKARFLISFLRAVTEVMAPVPEVEEKLFKFAHEHLKKSSDEERNLFLTSLKANDPKRANAFVSILFWDDNRTPEQALQYIENEFVTSPETPRWEIEVLQKNLLRKYFSQNRSMNFNERLQVLRKLLQYVDDQELLETYRKRLPNELDTLRPEEVEDHLELYSPFSERANLALTYFKRHLDDMTDNEIKLFTLMTLNAREEDPAFLERVYQKRAQFAPGLKREDWYESRMWFKRHQ